MKLFRRRLQRSLVSVRGADLDDGRNRRCDRDHGGGVHRCGRQYRVAKGAANIGPRNRTPTGASAPLLPRRETASAIIAYGVLDKGDFHNLSATMQTHLHSAVTWLLTQQNADGSFATDGYPTYDTGLTLDGLSSSKTVDPGVPTAIAKGRAYLIKSQQAPPAVTGNASSPNCLASDQPPRRVGFGLLLRRMELRLRCRSF